MNTLKRVINRGMATSGRNYTFIIDLVDKPGQLAEVCSVIGRSGGNVLSVTHERINTSTEINGCTVRFELETLNREHIDTLRQNLKDAGFKVLN